MTGLLFPFWTAVSYTVREETLDDWAFSIQRKMSLKVIFSPLPGRGCLQVRWVSWNESQRREWTVSLGSSFFYLLCLLQFASLTEVRSFKIFPKSKRRQRKSISHLFPSCQPKAGQTLTPVKLWGVISLLLCYFLLILVKSLLSFVERRNYLKCCVRWQKPRSPSWREKRFVVAWEVQTAFHKYAVYCKFETSLQQAMKGWGMQHGLWLPWRLHLPTAI